MRLHFLELPPRERRLYFEEAARRRGLSPIILEKDFWVCWMLGLLFGSTFRNSLVFKGGTSLSKVFGVIHRFSEDIDLSLAPAFLGLHDMGPTPAVSRTQGDKWMREAEQACLEAVGRRLRPELERSIADILGEPEGSWIEFAIEATAHSPALLFRYPTTQPNGFEYLQRSVKLEFGSLTDQQPIGRHSVRPWLADDLPQALEDWDCEVVSLEVERTFWEKATILHAEYHRPPGKPTPDRFSRHYADTAAMGADPIASQALVRHDLRERVVEWKRRFFASGWAAYDLARPGSFRLVPPDARIPNLRRDYQAMRDMYFSRPMSFEQILQELNEMEMRINGASSVRS
jgi:hypothetical protein